MRVLLSAYACEPNKGSEQEVGWQRALHMRAFADEVWVITRANNREVIERDPVTREPGLHFIYYDLPPWALWMKKKLRLLHLYYAVWQWGAFRLAARHHRDKPFDCVYHVTFTSMQFGSYMGRLGIPFVVGPLAGGERAPIALRRSMPVAGKTSECLRDLGIMIQRHSPLAQQACAAASRIYVASTDSLRLVHPRWRTKASVHLAIAAGNPPAIRRQGPRPQQPGFVFVGRLLHWKGAHLAIRALAESRRTIQGATLTIIGQGPAEAWLRERAKEWGVEEAVSFVGHCPRQRVLDSLSDYTGLLFPSLHDSGGMAILEAFSAGLPAICLDLGGPGVMVDASCGIVVSTARASEAQTVSGLAHAIIRLATMDPAEFECLSMGAIARAKELSWSALTKQVALCRGPSHV